MNGWNNTNYILIVLASNVLGLLILFFAWKNQRIGRLLLFFLFGWAGCTNWYTVTHSPSDYVDYANFALLPFYQSFIRGWFSEHVLEVVGLIATGQLMISIAMLLKGWLFRTASRAGIVFMFAIIPLGVSSGFPFPLIVSLAFYLLILNPAIDFIWKTEKVQRPSFFLNT
ncbi:MAG: hypothetical protein ACM3VS_06820 [Candidatus Dadabacteria bacterium]